MFDLSRMIHMIEMAVWDAEGRMYMPVYGYDGQIEAYAPKDEAHALFWKRCNETMED